MSRAHENIKKIVSSLTHFHLYSHVWGERPQAKKSQILELDTAGLLGNHNGNISSLSPFPPIPVHEHGAARAFESPERRSSCPLISS